MNMSTMGDVREQGSVDGMVADYLLPVPVWQNEVYRRYVAVGEVIADEFGIGVEELPSIPGNRALGPRGQIAFDTMDGEKR
ncbi:hypothetical protein HY415_02450 [Candidatus Kaiserbacteria bacterium]|nr:hypothetical protein [Candidatus Kaiserbacteria bacterium]